MPRPIAPYTVDEAGVCRDLEGRVVPFRGVDPWEGARCPKCGAPIEVTHRCRVNGLLYRA